jgi:hypothetical protein
MSTMSVNAHFTGFSSSSGKKFAPGAITMALVTLVLFLNCELPQTQAAAENEITKNEPLPVTVLEGELPDQNNVTAYAPEKIEQARAITAPRIAGLIGMWIFVAIMVVTFQIHLRNERKVIKCGYYANIVNIPENKD